MSNKKGGFAELFFDTIMPKIYGLGAAVVIVGAMFKIMHWEGASVMLVAGLSTEAAIFVFSAFEPAHAELDWSKVYPELKDDDFTEVKRKPKPVPVATPSGLSTSQSLDKMMSEAKIGPDLIKSLGEGMKNMATSASKMSSLSNAAVATSEYATNVKTASDVLVKMNKSYATTMTAMESMSEASKDAKQYHTVVQSVTKNLSALNAMYEMELGDTNTHLKAMNKFYSNLTTAMDAMGDAGKESQKFKAQMTSLTGNISSLNTVYGNMLNAMRYTGGSNNTVATTNTDQKAPVKSSPSNTPKGRA